MITGRVGSSEADREINTAIVSTGCWEAHSYSSGKGEKFTREAFLERASMYQGGQTGYLRSRNRLAPLFPGCLHCYSSCIVVTRSCVTPT